MTRIPRKQQRENYKINRKFKARALEIMQDCPDSIVYFPSDLEPGWKGYRSGPCEEVIFEKPLSEIEWEKLRNRRINELKNSAKGGEIKNAVGIE